MNKYKEDMVVNITEHLNSERDGAIKKVLDILDMSDISPEHKVKVRRTILEAINNFHLASCRVLTYIQEK